MSGTVQREVVLVYLYGFVNIPVQGVYPVNDIPRPYFCIAWDVLLFANNLYSREP